MVPREDDVPEYSLVGCGGEMLRGRAGRAVASGQPREGGVVGVGMRWELGRREDRLCGGKRTIEFPLHGGPRSL